MKASANQCSLMGERINLMCKLILTSFVSFLNRFQPLPSAKQRERKTLKQIVFIFIMTMRKLFVKTSLSLLCGEVYTGIWSDFKPDTFGAYSYSNGDCYVGEWRNGAKHGQGVYTYADGSRYEGNFDNDKFSGDGTLYESGIAKSVNWSRQGKQRRILQARRNCV